MVGCCWRLSLSSRHTLPSSLTFLSQQFTVDRENKKPDKTNEEIEQQSENCFSCEFKMKKKGQQVKWNKDELTYIIINVRYMYM